MNQKLWKRVINDKVVVNCKSRCESANFLDICNKKKLAIGEDTQDETDKRYGNNTCFRISNNEVLFGSSSYYIENKYKIVTYTELMEDKKTFTGPELFYFNQVRNSGKKIKYKDWDNFYTLQETLKFLSEGDSKLINEAFNKKIWEVEE